MFKNRTMKKTVLTFNFILFLITGLSAQKSETITVAAGTNVQDYFSFQQMYRYPKFTNGKVYFNNGATASSSLNYNLLSGEMDYSQSKDTLSIANPTDIKFIAIAKDTFYFDKGYLELIYSNKFKVALKQRYKQLDVVNKDSYGSSGSNSATDSYNSLQTAQQSYKLVINQDRIYKKVSDYYLVTPTGTFVPFSRKKVMQLFPQHKETIEQYLKSNKVDFDLRDDLIRFAGYLSDL
jgi:hypothetical protein